MPTSTRTGGPAPPRTLSPLEEGSRSRNRKAEKAWDRDGLGATPALDHPPLHIFRGKEKYSAYFNLIFKKYEAHEIFLNVSHHVFYM